MIKVENLSKRYAGVTAIDNISFHVEKGEVVGFLGPNGAGKSTTMKILSSFLPPTSGSASIAGHDVFNDSFKARQNLGYMPENVPLYTEMRVTEYLKYRGALKDIGRSQLRTRLGEVKELCSLKDVENRIIGTLSKGYRQRVGLADALIHDPPLLILDEPTIGLDPNQIRQVRELIKNLAQRHTILLSTHILSEVEMTCSRVIIINKGKIQASDSPANLVSQLRQSGHLFVEIKTAETEAKQLLSQISGVKEVLTETEGEWTLCSLRLEVGADPREQIFRIASERMRPIRELSHRRATLEDVFVEITHADH